MTVDEILSQKESPAIGLDDRGVITFINDLFERSYGWGRSEIAGKSVTEIIPPKMRDLHHIGFSRFLTTEKPTLLEKPLALPILCKDGRVLNVEHLIVAEKRGERWVFAATLKPGKKA